MLETYSPSPSSSPPSLSSLRGLTVAWVGDSNNILNDMIVSFARLGIHLRVATPKGYPLEEIVLKTAQEGLSNETAGGTATKEVLQHFHTPEEAVKGADIIVTDTWWVVSQRRAAVGPHAGQLRKNEEWQDQDGARRKRRDVTLAGQGRAGPRFADILPLSVSRPTRPAPTGG